MTTGRREKRAEELRARKEEKKQRRKSQPLAGRPLEALASAWNSEQTPTDEALAWMAKLVPHEGEARSLLVGGAIACTEPLVARDFRVVAIDENGDRIARVGSRMDAAVARRGRATATGPGEYAIDYGRFPDPIDPPATIIEADVIAERDLADRLLAFGPFDAVVATVDSPHDARLGNRAIAALGIADANRYRGELLARLYALADRVLFTDGVLVTVQAIDRAFSEDLAREVMQLHGALAAKTTLRFERVDAHAPLVAVRARKS